jgi:hypothetical protein
MHSLARRVAEVEIRSVSREFVFRIHRLNHKSFADNLFFPSRPETPSAVPH